MKNKNKESSNLNYRNKKGNTILDSILVLAVIFIFSLVSVVGYKLFTTINDDIQADTDLSDVAKNTSNDLHTRYPAVFDGAFVTILGLMWILVIVASFQIDTNPAFFAVALILLVAVLTISVLLSNSYQEFTADSEIATFAASFPMTNFIMSNLLKVIMVIAFSVMLVLFNKERIYG